MRGSLHFDFDRKSLDKFDATCQATIQNVFRGTKKATIAACETIINESRKQVPKDTTTLQQSSYYKVSRRTGTAATYWAYKGELGYGGNGDPINPKSGRPASSYMVAVHEDLSVNHPTGKAKFLEDPVRDYANKNFARAVIKHIKEALASVTSKE